MQKLNEQRIAQTAKVLEKTAKSVSVSPQPSQEIRPSLLSGLVKTALNLAKPLSQL